MATITEVPEESQRDELKQSQDVKTALNKSLSILHAAKNDNEQFAALLLVTQLVKSNELDSVSRKKLFDAVGFNFINRLLNSKDIPEGCSEDVFQSLGITLLACFASDEELLVHPQMLSKISLFIDLIYNSSGSLPDSTNHHVVEDCYQILYGISSSRQGCQQLLNQATAPKLCKIITRDIEGYKQPLQVLLQIVNNFGVKCWSNYSKDLFAVLQLLVRKFREIQDLEKFELCQILVVFLSSTNSSLFPAYLRSWNISPQWETDMYVALLDILQSKVGPKQRDPALQLSSILINILGMGWALGPLDDSGKADPKFVTIIINLACIEVKMTLQYCDKKELCKKQSLISSCYTILENAITFLILSSASAEGNTACLYPPLEESLSTKVYSIMVEAFKAVVKYLLDISVQGSEVLADEEGKSILNASMRMLCAWLAEDPEQVHEDLVKLLPFMLNVARESLSHLKGIKQKSKSVKFEESLDEMPGITSEVKNLDISCDKSPSDLVRFLLPPLCHLTTDDKLRDILIKNDLMSLLEDYLLCIWDTWSGIGCTEVTSLQTLCSILLNLIVLDKELVKTSPIFKQILDLLSKALLDVNSDTKHVVLVGNFITLGLMIIHHRKEVCSQIIFKKAVWFLSESKWIKNSPESQFAQVCQERWEDISELWLLSMQIITECLISHATLLPLINETEWIRDIISWLSVQKSFSSAEEDYRMSYQNLITTVEKVKKS